MSRQSSSFKPTLVSDGGNAKTDTNHPLHPDYPIFCSKMYCIECPICAALSPYNDTTVNLKGQITCLMAHGKDPLHYICLVNDEHSEKE